MIRKLLIGVALTIILAILFMSQKQTIISVFNMTEEPVVISKGNYGQSVILEVSFSHDGFLEWLNTLKQPYPLLMLDADWIERSPQFVEEIKRKNIPTGLLGKKGDKNYSIDTLSKEIAIYEKNFKEKPLWFMTSDYKYTQELKQFVFNEKINMLSPTVILNDVLVENDDKNKGSIISIQLHENSKPNFNDLTKFLSSRKFISIEENIFGYSFKTNKYPQ